DLLAACRPRPYTGPVHGDSPATDARRGRGPVPAARHRPARIRYTPYRARPGRPGDRGQRHRAARTPVGTDLRLACLSPMISISALVQASPGTGLVRVGWRRVVVLPVPFGPSKPTTSPVVSLARP